MVAVAAMAHGLSVGGEVLLQESKYKNPVSVKCCASICSKFRLHRVPWLDPYDFIVDADISTFKSVCVDKCPAEIGGSVCEYDRDYLTNYNVPLASSESNAVGSGPCYMILMETFPLHGKCVPKPPKSLNNVNLGTSGAQNKVTISDKLYDRVTVLLTKNMLRDYAIDIMNGWAILLSCGVAAGLLFSLIWIGALRNYAKAVIWISILLVNVVSLAYALFCYFKAGIIKYKGAAIGQQLVDKFKGAPAGLDFTVITGRQTFQWYGNVMIGVSSALILLSVITLSRLKNWIEVTVKCLEVCSEAIDAVQPIQVTQAVVYTQINTMQRATSPHIPNMVQPQEIPAPHQITYRGGQEVQTPKFMTQVVQPIRPSSISLLWERLQAPFFRPLLLVTMPILCITIACWLTVLFFIISICNIQTQSDGTYAFVWTWRFYVLVAYHSFGLAWAWQFINGLNDIVIAGSISYYYWHRYTVFAPVVQVLVSTLRYNVGSAIFGGLFFAPALLFLRNVCRSINKLVQSLQQLGKQVPMHVTSGVDRTLSCMENVISYFNKNALILVAIKGKDYCQSASLARDRLQSNALLVDTISVSPDRLLIIGKILVCFSCTICALAMSILPIYSDTSSSSYITSPIFLILMTTVIAYTMAHTLLQVHKTTWDTLILNLCEDCERTNGRPQYPPALLIQLAQMKLEMKAAKQKQQQEQARKAESDVEKAVDEE